MTSESGDELKCMSFASGDDSKAKSRRSLFRKKTKKVSQPVCFLEKGDVQIFRFHNIYIYI